MSEFEAKRRQRRGRRMLAVIGVGAVAAILAPTLLRAVLLRDTCPMTTDRNGSADGVTWYRTRADCGDGRVTVQLWIVPQKGVATPVYEVEEGPLPLDWRQAGFSGEIRLERPLADESESSIAVRLDSKGRPTAPVRVKDGRRLR